ncbi:hypothetical protein PVT71_21755 [Salipiger sp. H15]|uniref:LysM domain-containing protein n=1 Tax=Alloyangia sp. H15 TaxID=3029062 RepID=A0AAU8ALR8_9RHOB
MKNPIQAMYEAGIVEASDFPPDSRYSGIPTTTVRAADGRLIPCLARRFVPPPEDFATLGYRVLREGERLDLLAAEAMGAPGAWWQLCDANRAVFAEELETPGTEIRLTLPRGVPAGEEAP